MQGFSQPAKIIDREDEYNRRRLVRQLSPARHDAFAMGDKTPDPNARTYADTLREQMLDMVYSGCSSKSSSFGAIVCSFSCHRA